jgi:hypothetical protein
MLLSFYQLFFQYFIFPFLAIPTLSPVKQRINEQTASRHWVSCALHAGHAGLPVLPPRPRSTYQRHSLEP